MKTQDPNPEVENPLQLGYRAGGVGLGVLGGKGFPESPMPLN